MLVQYEDQDRPPPLGSTWSWQDNQGSWLLITLAWIGVLVGVGGALYWAHLSVLGAFVGGSDDWPGFVWLSLTAAGAALIAPVLWPFLEERRPAIAKFVLTIGILCWIITSILGSLYLIGKSQREGASLATSPAAKIERALADAERSIAEATHDCERGIRRGCDWLDSRGGRETAARRADYRAELARRRGPLQALPPPSIRAIMTIRERLLLFATVAIGGSIALAMIWGSAEGLKAMYSEPGHLLPGMPLPADGLSGGAVGMDNPIDQAFDAWARRSLEAARGERAAVATMYAHYRGDSLRRGLPTYMGDEAFGRALARRPDPNNPNDLGGPMTRYGAYPIKTGGKMEYVGVRIRPDDVLDEIEASA